MKADMPPFARDRCPCRALFGRGLRVGSMVFKVGMIYQLSSESTRVASFLHTETAVCSQLHESIALIWLLAPECKSIIITSIAREIVTATGHTYIYIYIHTRYTCYPGVTDFGQYPSHIMACAFVYRHLVGRGYGISGLVKRAEAGCIGPN